VFKVKSVAALRTFTILVLFCGLIGNLRSSSAPAAAPSPPVFASSILPDVRVSPALDADPHDEPSIVTSAVDDQVLVGASKVILGAGTGDPNRSPSRVVYYSSSDGGATWLTSLLSLQTNEKMFDITSDPAVACDADGNFYLSVLMVDSHDSGNFDNGAYVFKSTDNGRTFGNPIPAFVDIADPEPKLADKPSIAIDTSPSSPFRNSVYVAWVEIDPGHDSIRISHLRPGDAGFSPQKSISHSGDMRGPSVGIGPNGEVCVAWEGIGDPKTLLFNESNDGGETFLPPTIAPGGDFKIHSFVGSLSSPNATIQIAGVPRMASFPSIDVDRSSGPHRGTIYVVWAETTNSHDADILLMPIAPFDGVTVRVGPIVRVNNDSSGADQFFPSVNVDPSTGVVYVAFYDRRDTGGFAVNAYLARSSDGGATFPDNFKISSAQSNPQIQASIRSANGEGIGLGDYIGLSAIRGRARVAWTDTRDGKQEIFLGEADFDPTTVGKRGPQNDACLSPLAIATLPFTTSLDTAAATAAQDDPVLCSGGQGSNTVWYRISVQTDTVMGIDTAGSGYDTVLSVFTGGCGSLTRIACNDDFAGGAAGASLLTFQATSGVVYLIDVAGKGSGGPLQLRAGYPTVTTISYTPGPDGRPSLQLTGAGFVNGSAQVIVQASGSDTVLTDTFFTGQPQGDGTVNSIFGTKRKLKKLVQPGLPLLVRVESPIGSGRQSVPFPFTR